MQAARLRLWGDFVTKCSAVVSVKPWMSRHFSESRDRSYVGSAMCSECPKKDRRGKSCWLHPRESAPDIDQWPGGVTASPTLLGPVLCGASRASWDFCLSGGISSPPRTATPTTLPAGQSGRENEWIRDGAVQDFLGPVRPYPVTSSPLAARGPRTFILFQTRLTINRLDYFASWGKIPLILP